MKVKKGNQGFASMTPEKRKELASKGGKAHSKEHMRKIGKKGGTAKALKDRAKKKNEKKL